MNTTQDRPRRTWTKRRSDAALAFCGFVIVYVLGWRHDSPLAETALAYAFGTAAAVLGLYQVIGHADYRTKRSREGEP